eukprot:15083394-Heterocapsa_arctica.AAC.1
MGHEFQTCGDYEYCLGCGRNIKAKHSKSANLFYWRSEYRKPVTRMKRYRTRNHDIKIDEDPDDSEHKHNNRKKDKEEENADKKNEEDNKDPDD